MKFPWAHALFLVLIAAGTRFDSGAAMAQDTAATTASPQTFALTDHNGQPVTADSYLGRFALIYFGYTNCPDICPTILADLADTLDILGDNATRIAPVFVSVDSQRDTPEILAGYVAQFHPQIIGLSGTASQIHDVTKFYGAPYTLKKAGDDIRVNHTGSGVFVGPDGDTIAIFPHGMPTDFLASEITQFMSDWNHRPSQ